VACFLTAAKKSRSRTSIAASASSHVRVIAEVLDFQSARRYAESSSAIRRGSRFGSGALIEERAQSACRAQAPGSHEHAAPGISLPSDQQPP